MTGVGCVDPHCTGCEHYVTKVTLLGPAPYGGSLTGAIDDPMVRARLAGGWTVLRTWDVHDHRASDAGPATPRADLSQGDLVDVLDEAGDWLRVTVVAVGRAHVLVLLDGRPAAFALSDVRVPA